MTNANETLAELRPADRDDELIELLAARTAVLHRRTRQDAVRIAYRPARGRETLLTIDLTGDPTFAELHGEVRAAVLNPPGGRPGDEIDLRHRHGGTDTEEAFVRGPCSADGDDPAEVLEAQVRRLQAAARAEPDLPVSALPMAAAADHAELLGWGRYGEPAIQVECIHEMVAAQAARRPTAPAVSSCAKTLTYGELDEWAGRLAAALAERCVGPGDVVGVLAERSCELVVALLAVLKCGAAYLALETDAPSERVERSLGDAGVRIVLTDCLAEPPPWVFAIPIGALDDPAQAPMATPPPAPAVRPDDLAYVSFTSGSTGRPKGVAVTHAAVSRLVRSPDWADFKEDDVFLQLAPVAFDASTLEIWAPLTIGAKLAVHPPGRVDLDLLAATIEGEGVTVLWLTAGLFHQMVADRLESFSGLRHLIAGGDVISATSVRQVMARHPRLTFTNGYGPTENTTFTTCWTTPTSPNGDAVPIGRPISGTRVAILDRRLRPVPVGVPGELYAGGIGLARGYVGRAAATAERFVPDPLSPEPGARMYRTGDLARWRTDGGVDFLGRADRQVKIHGFRVEPGEVEAAILASPSVCTALVISEEEGICSRRLAAFVTPADPKADPVALASELRAGPLSALPAYLVPARLLIVDRLPLNSNGKIDRSLLERTRRAPRSVVNPYVAPRDAIESFLAELWSAAIGVEPVGVDDDFFELGGHSLIAGELLGRVQQEFGVELPARVLYMHPTVCELGLALRERLGLPSTETCDFDPAGSETKGTV